MSKYKYCQNLDKYVRYPTRIVNIGDIPLGGDYPIRIQSMTTTNTLDVDATVEQTKRIFDFGADYVRITAPSIKEARILKDIKEKLNTEGYTKPIIADIHFTPNAALEAAQIVEKVRINPGNYADNKKFKVFEFTDIEYENELNRIYDRFSPLVKVCKENGTAMRIGTNHGSLSDRIMNRYGDTPIGMVESALEFLRICEDHNFHDIVLSMKSSNPIIMVQAYRLLVNKMLKENMFYPLHLGVTEAGEGIEGRIKSSIGIGSLLEDGLGDTVRVSLTEEPEFEIPIAKKIVNRYNKRENHSKINHLNNSIYDPFNYKRRETNSILNIGGGNVPVVVLDLSENDIIDYDLINSCGYRYMSEIDKWEINDLASDYIYLGENKIDIELPLQLKIIYDYSFWSKIENKINVYPKLTIDEYLNGNIISCLKFLEIDSSHVLDFELIKLIKKDKELVILLETSNIHGMVEQRNFICHLIKNKIRNPIIINLKYKVPELERLQIDASVDSGGLFVDGFGDGLFISNSKKTSIDELNKLSFEILQSTRTRITKTDFISCPSCGRTQFDLMKTTALVREKTSHLKGLKIAIMGCIVNGPGEMADADYGYVGTGVKKISLYKGHNVIKRGIPSEKSVDELIKLIKKYGDWIDP
ncbi:MAG: 4-hydroxy-3-methylbut-2-en-1-yl diphosphate synthase [Candidatus Marinimicrobia bacterium]|nr:4-hydroxy-3-methylbut-2-en-1-yl diphosphate synthase [Candidatus Neomarinimicrobiota bacterium]|tara:strand:- start:7858 stop:9786 length:1929 start_codon:yes stop_codon:yes gene_type:complete